MTRFAVSVKGVVLDDRKVALLKNERDEWELPGGKLEAKESPEACVEREVLEELGLHVEAGPLLDAWVYDVIPGARVLILTYGCYAERLDGLLRSEEHSDARFFGIEEVEGIKVPDGYKRSIVDWSRHPAMLERSRGGVELRRFDIPDYGRPWPVDDGQ